MPEWLLKKDEYIPPKDKDTFINKSILTLLNMLSSFSKGTQYNENKYKVNTSVKMFTVLLIIILISLSKSLLFQAVIGGALLLIVSLQPVKRLKDILFYSGLTVTFTLIIFTPSIIMGNVYNSMIVILKVFISVTSVGLLSRTSSLSELTSSLKFFFMPDILILILDITIKYIVLLGELSLNMLYALKIRTVGKNRNKYKAMSGIIGTMFIKSREMAEDMYGAMECRGFSGEYNRKVKFKLGFLDYIFILINVIIVLAYIYL